MQRLNQQTTGEDFSRAWCNANAVTSSVMEAVSLITPVLETFFIRTVAEAMPPQRDGELGLRCQEFIREESNHSRIHRRFNAALLHYLGKTPPGLALVEAALNGARRHLSLAHCLLLAAALEHLAAVLSKVYVGRESSFRIDSEFARELFALHAREEIAHCSVVFDLWRSRSSAGRIGRALTILLILFAGLVYVVAAVPWILHRKHQRRLRATLLALAGFARRSPTGLRAYSPLGDLFSFIQRDYHPDHLFKNGGAGAH
jgi:hypothetical protein